MTAENEIQERIQDIDLRDEMQESFLEYSYSVIYARALPDARDGLKPVQRRIIYQMGDMGLRPDKGHVKSARVAGEVMGKLHPHGDSAIYDAMVRLAQPFTLRVPLIDGHGNFGSLDDGPAAARYTEARLSPAALLMNQDLDEDTVDFRPNYDAQLTEPEVLPAAFPNLLVNGSSGIAVGMATNMAPHNLREVVAAARHLLENPHATLDDLMAHLPGPDLPTGAIITNLEGIREAYESGRGIFKMRAKVAVESVGPRKLGLVVTELPYLVGPEKVIEKIKDGVNSKKLQGISDVTDLTDRANGLKLVIGLKTGFDPAAVLELLYKFTPLEESFGINNVTLVAGRPATLGLRDLLGVYLAHRVLVTRRRSKNRLGKKQARLHLLEGLLIAILSIDEVIQVIRSSEEADEERAKLMQVFDLSAEQAEYILELRLRRLTKFSKIELYAEAAKLRATQQNIKTQESSRVRDMLDRELARLPLDLAEVQFNANKDKLTGSDELIIKGKLDTMRREVQQQQQKAEEQTIRTNVSSRIDALLSTPFGDPAKGIPPAALASVPPEIKVPTSNGGVVSISTNELVQANLNRRFAEIDASPGTPDDKIRLKADLVASNPVKYDGWSRIAAGANNLALDQTTGKASPAFVEAAKLYGDVSPHYAGLLDKYFPDNGTAKRAVAATVAAARARTLNPGDPPDYAEAARDVLLRVPNWKAFSNLTFQQKRPDEYFDKQIKSIASGGDKSVKNRGDVANEVRTLTEFYAAAGNMTEKDALAEAIKQVSASHINVNGWAVNSQGNLPTSGQNTLTVRQLEFLLQKASEQYHAANKDLLPGFGVEDITFRPGPRDGTWIPAYGNTGMIAPNAQGWIITNKALLEVLGESASNAKSVNADLDRMFGKSRTLPRAPSYFVGGPGGIPGDAKLPGLGSIFGTSE